MKRIIFTLLMVVSYMLTSHAANIFTISDVQGRPGEEVTVSVSLDNSDAVSAVDMTIPLDRQLTYVDGSCVLNSLRANGHQITAGANDSELRVVIYDLNTNVLKGNSGELFSFKLRLKKEPQTYTLTATSVLGNATGGNIPSSVEPGSVTIRSPKLTVITTKVDYGHIPIRSTYTQNVTIQNSGNERLEVSGVAFSANEFSTDETLFSIDAGDTKDITINYAPVKHGAISETVTFNSNAINGKQKATLVADPFSVNELHVGSAMGASDEEVTISLTMNNMEPIVGVQCEFVLPDQLVYVPNSFEPSPRAAGLNASSIAVDGRLQLILYSVSGAEISGNDGEIATFKLRLNGNTGWYGLEPQNVVLSNTAAENMTSDVSSGSVEIKSPSLHAESTLSMGDTPANETATAKYQINNYGEIALKIERVVFLAEGYSIAEQLPISIDPWQSTEITVQYKSTVKGHHSTQMNIYTNDPQNRMKQVEVSGNVYEPNSLELSGEFTEDGYDLSVSLKNYSEIVAMQMDIHWLNGMNIPSDGIKSSNRLDGLSSTVTKIGNGSYRIIIFSLNNTPIKGNDGEIFTLSYVNNGAETIDNSVISIDNLVFSTNKSENVSSESLFSYTIPARLAESIELNLYKIEAIVGEIVMLKATVYPDNTIEKGVVWSVSDDLLVSIEPIDNTSARVCILQEGVATVTAKTVDGSDLSATCTIDIYSDINSVCVDSEAVKYYDLNGFNVKNPTNGVYIKVIGSKVKKVAL